LAGLAAMLAAASASAKDADVTQVIADAHIPCTVTAQRAAGEGALADGTQVKSYEVACQEGLGYIVLAKQKAGAAPITYDCLAASEPGKDGKPNPMACKLPANAHPADGLNPVLQKAGADCTVDKGRWLGATKEQTIYEALCKNGQDLLLLSPLVAGGPAPVVDTCLSLESGGGGSLKCSLSTPAEQLALVDPLVASSNKACSVKDKRYVLSTNTDYYYEVACADGKGFMMKVDKTGKVGQTVDCAQASYIGGGCTMTDARKAQTEEAALFSSLSKKAGFDCQISKYESFPQSDSSRDVIEMQCSNRPDGAVGVFPSSGTPQVFDCLRAQAHGFRCSMTSIDPLFSKLTAQLKARGRGSCAVSGARPLGTRSATSDFVEVACADGGPGWVIEYPFDGQTPSNLYNCVQAKSLTGEACQLPTNQIK
jgi:hypothetical protein